MHNIENPILDVETKHPSVEHERFLEYLVLWIATSNAFARIIRTLLPYVLEKWAGKNVFKKAVAALAAKSIKKSYASEYTIREPHEFLNDPVFAKSALEELPNLLNSFFSSIQILGENILRLTPEEKERLIGEFVTKIDGTLLANIFNNMLRCINEIYSRNPKFFSEHVSAIFSSFVERADFGELKELFEKSGRDVEELAKRLNEDLWKYPAKVICVLSILPTIINNLMSVFKETLAPANQLAPDLLSDVIFSLIKEIDGKNIAKLTNELSELVRKIHTGSALLGEPGKPQFSKVMAKLIGEVVHSLNFNSLLRALEIYREMAHMMFVECAEVLETQPEMVGRILHLQICRKTFAIKELSRKLELLNEALINDDELEKFAESFSEIDLQEITTVVEQICVFINRLRTKHVTIFQNAISQLFASFDSYEVGKTIRNLTNDIVAALRPHADQIMPPLICAFAELISENAGNEKINAAIEKLRNVLLIKEVAR